jgi:hypothetical protein
MNRSESEDGTLEGVREVALGDVGPCRDLLEEISAVEHLHHDHRIGPIERGRLVGN